MPPASPGQALFGFGGLSCSHIWHLRSPWLPVPELNRAAGSGCAPQCTGASDFLGAWAAAESPWVFCFHKTPLKDSKSHHALIREKFENKEEHDSAVKNHHSFLQLSLTWVRKHHTHMDLAIQHVPLCPGHFAHHWSSCSLHDGSWWAGTGQWRNWG